MGRTRWWWGRQIEVNIYFCLVQFCLRWLCTNLCNLLNQDPRPWYPKFFFEMVSCTRHQWRFSITIIWFPFIIGCHASQGLLGLLVNWIFPHLLLSCWNWSCLLVYLHSRHLWATYAFVVVSCWAHSISPSLVSTVFGTLVLIFKPVSCKSKVNLPWISIRTMFFDPYRIHSCLLDKCEFPLFDGFRGKWPHSNDRSIWLP